MKAYVIFCIIFFLIKIITGAIVFLSGLDKTDNNTVISGMWNIAVGFCMLVAAILVLVV